MPASEARRFISFYLDELRTLPPGAVRSWSFTLGGSAGLAYTLFRAATVSRGTTADADLALASRWSRHALHAARAASQRRWPKASYAHGFPGLHALAARIAWARGDHRASHQAVHQFVVRAARGRGSLELLGGTAGRLAGASALYRELPDPRIRELGVRLATTIAARLRRRDRSLPDDGVAHGWPGVLLGLVAWERVVPTTGDAVLRALVDDAHPYVANGPGFAYGHIGQAILFAHAYERLGEPRYLAWARDAGRLACELPSYGQSLVGGSVGIAYGLFVLAAIDPGGPWRAAARARLATAIRDVEPPKTPLALWTGLSGMCCLALDSLRDRVIGLPGIDA